MTYPLRVICGTVKPSLGLLAIQGRARQKSLGAAGVLPTTQNPLTAATATESGLLDCTILLLEGIRVHTTWPLSGCARATGSACVRPTNGRLPQSAFSFELHSQRIDCTSHRSFRITHMPSRVVILCTETIPLQYTPHVDIALSFYRCSIAKFNTCYK